MDETHFFLPWDDSDEDTYSLSSGEQIISYIDDKTPRERFRLQHDNLKLHHHLWVTRESLKERNLRKTIAQNRA